MPEAIACDDLVLVHVVHGEEQVVHRADGVGRRSRSATSIGSFMYRRTRWPTSPSSVAENSIVWCVPVTLRRIHSTCGVKPSSAIRSASSSTTISTLLRSSSFSFNRSISRSGVATITSTPRLQHVDLLMARGAAVDGEHGAVAAGSDRGEHLGDLQRQLARRHEHHRQRAAGVGFARQPGEHRHAERQRLAGAGLGSAADVAAGEGDRDRLGLDRERSGEPGSGESHVDLGRHAEVDERRRDVGVGIDRDGCGFDRSAGWTWCGFAAPTPRCPRWAGVFRHVEHGGYRPHRRDEVSRRPHLSSPGSRRDGRRSTAHLSSHDGAGDVDAATIRGHEGRTHRQRLPPPRRADLSAPRRRSSTSRCSRPSRGEPSPTPRWPRGPGPRPRRSTRWGSASASGSPSSATTRRDCSPRCSVSAAAAGCWCRSTSGSSPRR